MDGLSKSAAKAALTVIVISASSKLLGLVRESVFASTFGATAGTDAYKIAFGIPYMLLAWVTASIATTFIPVYAGYLRSRNREESLRFLNNLFTLTALVSVLICGSGMFFSPALVRLAAPGFNSATYGLAVELTLILLPSLIFVALSNLSAGFLQSSGRFTPAAFVWIPYNLIGVMFFTR